MSAVILPSSPPPPTTTTTTPYHPVRIVSFDGWSFAEQVVFMNSVDVLISPHGAQLTSIPFLPNCASILELFPQGYHPPYYFGSLAVASGVTHSYTSLTRGFQQYFQDEIQTGMANATNCNACRNVQLCPPVLDLVEQIMIVI
jgi:Glycosyltransferase 61